MAASYLHGVETVELQTGPRTVLIVKSAVIGLIGAAPIGPVNTPTIVQSDKDAAQLGGYTLPGFNIPQALTGIFDQGAGTVIVINVCDPAVHKTTVTAETVTLDYATGIGKTAFPALTGTPLVKNSTGLTTYVAGTDYTLDALTGKITRISTGAIAAGTSGSPTTLKVTYDYTDPTKILAADIVGATSGAGVRTGIQALRDTYNLFGFYAKILISPSYCTQASVMAALESMAGNLKAMAYLDAPYGTTPAVALTGRGPAGAINFYTSAERSMLFYPNVQVFDSYTNAYRYEGISARAAGLRAATDINNGYWFSSSNRQLKGVTGVEVKLSAMIDDSTSDVNLLNAAGITTIFSSFGTGYRLWGNRNASYPTSTLMTNFECVRRTDDIINESMRYFSLQFIDLPINQALIDALTESANQAGRKWIGDGAMLGFKCWYDPARNPSTEIANGHLLLNYKFTPPPPLERLTWEVVVTGEYLLTLGKS